MSEGPPRPGLWQVKPVQHLSGEREGDSYEYQFSSVALDDVDPEELDVNGVTVRFVEDGLLMWKYKDKTAVYISKDAVFVKEGSDRREAERQAFHSLGILSDMGLVRNWGRK